LILILGINCLHFSGGNMNPSLRRINLDKFLYDKDDHNILACTDLVSRGIDTQSVSHVVNYDFPAAMTDYLHRVGRVGRVGARQQGGKVTSLVCGKVSIALVQELEKSVRQNKAMDVESNIISIFEKQRQLRNTD
jgi:superfamily II DNA/RNA helicase